MSDENVIENVAGLNRLTPGEWVIDADGDALCLVDTHLGWPQRMWMPKAKKGTVGLVVSLEHARFPVALAEIDPSYVCTHGRGTNECGHCYLCGVVVAEARSGLSWEEDAMYTVRRAALAWVDGVCQYCEAEPGDNEYCAIDGSPHPWATNQTDGGQ